MYEKFQDYKFALPLERGKIIGRPNRFIMQVEKDGDIFACHCPSTGKIGDVVFDNVPCLLSKSTDEKRKTSYTVEAIFINEGKFWLGINQNNVNRYVEHFFRIGALDEIVKNGCKILREQKIGGSKLDFKIENTYVEVKMPLQFLSFTGSARLGNKKYTLSPGRFVRHITELGNLVQKNENALMLVCFIYDAPIFTPPKPTEQNKIIANAVRKSIDVGVKMWQINMNIDSYGVKLLKYYDITDHLLGNEK